MQEGGGSRKSVQRARRGAITVFIVVLLALAPVVFVDDRSTFLLGWIGFLLISMTSVPTGLAQFEGRLRPSAERAIRLSAVLITFSGLAVVFRMRA